jgi:hypothetical protein
MLEEVSCDLVESPEVLSEVFLGADFLDRIVTDVVFEVMEGVRMISCASGVKGLYLILPLLPGEGGASRRFDSFPKGGRVVVEVVN